MPRHSGKKKKALPLLAEATDLSGVFGIGVDFAEEVEASLAEVDLALVLVEKKGGVARPPTRKERLATYPPPEEELNLHGCTGEEAARKTVAFVTGAAVLRLRTVLIITGKGLHSPGPPVLPLVVDGCLEELQLAGAIFHYSWGPKGRDHSGAVAVFLG
ncbi:MAG: Smr/MutS family protein [Desulfobulbaceae bacterium]|nr:Smr/MutS family protein [Desulfobulbaceae bacterium]